MINAEFAPGQRWISNTEAELGLGIVERLEGRQVVLLFPAAQEQRIYAINEAPISRVEYRVGDQLRTDDSRTVTVAKKFEREGCWVYEGVDTDGKAATVEEWELDSFVRFSRPQDRLFSGQLDNNRKFELRLETLRFIHTHGASPGFGFLGPRVELLPHQIYIATEVANRYAPRVLLADEVGLGKTIEAGLILHHQLVSGQAQRVLIVVPSSLVHQWFVEMARRLNLSFTILDEERCEELEASGTENPFESAQLVLCALPLLTKTPERHRQALDAGWDLLIVDEAHHLAWEPDHVSVEYERIEALASNTRGAMLLTATPEQLGVEGHFARLRLLDPDRYHDLEEFVAAEQQYEAISSLIDRVAELESPDDNDAKGVLNDLAKTIGDEHVEELSAATDWRQAITDALLDQHGTGRVLFRNTRATVGGFPKRQQLAESLPIPEPAAQSGWDTSAALRPEHLFGDDWTEVDPRVEWLVAFLRERRNEKVLLICELATTAQALEEHLRARAGIRSALFHEGMGLIARDRAAAYFAESDLEEGAQILVCSEIGSEGRNFQFAHELVMFDLPRHPDLLEQRIGRLDRIGQRRDVLIYAPVFAGSAQETLQRWYHEGLNAFETPFPAADRVFRRVSSELEGLLDAPFDEPAVSTLVANTHELAQQTLRTLSDGRSRLLELNSCRPARADEAIEAIESSARAKELEDYMSRIFDEFGVEIETHGPRSVVIRPGNHMVCEQFPALPEDGVSATFSRNEALAREDLQFLTWEHPMIAGATDMVLNGDFGRVTLCTLKMQGVSPGRVFLEGIFLLRCPAPKHFRIQRFLPQALVRFVVDENGKDHGEILTQEVLHSRVANISSGLSREVVKHIRTNVDNMADAAEALAAKRESGLRAEALALMDSEFTVETRRLEALQRVNPNVRELEIDYLRELRSDVERALERAYLEFDSLRVLITTE